MQDAQILDVACAAGFRFLQAVVCFSEHQIRKERLAISVSLKRAGLADQRPNDVSIVDLVSVLAMQSFHRKFHPAVEERFKAIVVHANLQILADQSRWH